MHLLCPALLVVPVLLVVPCTACIFASAACLMREDDALCAEHSFMTDCIVKELSTGMVLPNRTPASMIAWRPRCHRRRSTLIVGAAHLPPTALTCLQQQPRLSPQVASHRCLLLSGMVITLCAMYPHPSSSHSSTPWQCRSPGRAGQAEAQSSWSPQRGHGLHCSYRTSILH